MTGRPSVPPMPELRVPQDEAAEKAKKDRAAKLESKRRRASTILTGDLEEPETVMKQILGG